MLTGCYAVLPAKHDNTVSITKDNIKSLNGCYSNISDTLGQYYSSNLWNNINHMSYREPIYGAQGQIMLYVLNDKRINVTLLLDDSLQYTRILKGKVKDDYFVTKKKFLLIGIPPILFIEKSLRMQLTLTSDSNLLVDSKAGAYAAIFMSAGQTSKSQTQYKRVK